MGRRLAMIAAEGDYTSPWFHPLGVEREVRVTGGGEVSIELEGPLESLTRLKLPHGFTSLPDIKNVKRYRVTKRVIADDEPTTVEVIY